MQAGFASRKDPHQPFSQTLLEQKPTQRAYHTAGQTRQKLHGKDEILSRGDESLGIESSYRFKGRGSEFHQNEPQIYHSNYGGVADDPYASHQ